MCFYSPCKRKSGQGFLLKAGTVGLVLMWLGLGGTAAASQPIQLDPHAQPLPPPTIIRAVILEEHTKRRCSLRLMPNSVVVLLRPCALEGRVGLARQWLMDAGSIVLMAEDKRILFRFNSISPRAYRTRGAETPQLTLSLLPATSMPMSE